jgi:hypothetical protein
MGLLAEKYAEPLRALVHSSSLVHFLIEVWEDEGIDLVCEVKVTGFMRETDACALCCLRPRPRHALVLCLSTPRGNGLQHGANARLQCFAPMRRLSGFFEDLLTLQH